MKRERERERVRKKSRKVEFVVAGLIEHSEDNVQWWSYFTI
jgi:hypothetical protein